VVAGPAYYSLADPGPFDRSWRGICVGTFHLYAVLMMNTNKQMETVLVIVLGLTVAYWLKRANGLLLAAILIGLAGLFVPMAAQGIHWAWMGLSRLLGAVSGRILLTLVYVLVLVPLSFLARRMGKISMRTKPGGSTYFIARNHTYTKEDIQHPW
jgi:hypothetical protein